MALTAVANGTTISHNDINQIINVLQQPSGGQEVGKYVLSGNSYTASSGTVSLYIGSLSNDATPVSVTVDTSDIAKPSYFGTITTNHLTSGGFQVYSQWTQINGGGAAGGNYTIQY